MKGIVLAGGTGSRLRPLTHTRQKQTLPVGTEPILVRAVRRLRQAGVTDVGVVLGDGGRERIRRLLGTGEEFGVDVSYVTQGEPRGLADAIGCCESFVGTEPFLVHFGDTVFGASLAPLVEAFDPDEMDALLGVQPVDDPTEHAVVVRDDRGTARTVHEKPDDPPSDVSPVVDVFTPRIFDAIADLTPSARGELEIIDAIQATIDEGGRVDTLDLDGWWLDAGTPDGYLRANRYVLDELVDEGTTFTPARTPDPEVGFVAEDARIADEATVEPPVVVGEGAAVTGSATVGPYAVVEEGASVDSASVSRSVLLANARLAGDVAVTDSVLGSGATVEGDGRDGARLLVGDDSRVEW